MGDGEAKGDKKKKGIKYLIVLMIFLVVVACIVILLINLFREDVTYTSVNSKSEDRPSLYCTTNSKEIPGAFFDLQNAESAEQAVKVLFKNKKIDDIAYNASISYSDESLAKNEESNLNAKYGLYMQDHSAKITDFSTNFSASKSNLKINIFATSVKLTPALAKIFLIDTTDANLDNYIAKALSNLYRSKGFKCEISE